MPIPVTCPCGKTFAKPDHKAGTRFRCHLCGREVLIPKDAPAPEPTYALQETAEDPKVDEVKPRKTRRTPRKVSRQRLVLRHDYTVLRVCGGFLAFLGGSFLLAGIRFTAAPPAGPGRGAAAPVSFVPILVAGAVFIGLGVLLWWLASRLAERFEADERGIAWHRGGRLRASLPWGDIRRIRLQDAWGRLVLEGPPDTPVLAIRNGFKQYDELLARIQQTVDWEALIRARPAAGAVDVPGAGRAERTLPLVHQRRVPFWASVAGTVVLIVLSVYFWTLPAGGPAPAADAAGRREQEKTQVQETVLKFGLPLLCLPTIWGIFNCWTQFRVDAEGIAFRYFLRSRRYSWSELASVQVKIRVVVADQSKRYYHALVIRPRGEAEITLGFGDQSFDFRDTIVRAAAREGVTLRTDA
jgi:hypothetical protein